MAASERPAPGPTGVGLGLRWAFIDEVAAGDAPAALRFFEVSPENYLRRGGHFPAALAAVAARYPLLSHGLMLGIGGDEPLDRAYLAQVRALLDELGLDRHSDHLCWTTIDGRCLHDLLPLPTDRAIVGPLVDRIRRAQDLLGRPLALENISYYGAPGWSPADAATMGFAERDLLCEVIDRAGCGLLLDVNNVLVNATNHGFDPLAYLRGLDLDRVVQLHVAGGERISRLADLVIDTHGAAVPPEVVSLMSWVIARTGPLPVIYERDNKIPALAELAREVEHLQAAYDAALAAPAAAGALAREPARAQDLGELAAIQRGFAAHLIGAPAGDGGLLPEALEAMGRERLDVYRELVRGSLHRLLGDLLPRTVARLGEDAERWIDAWLAELGPRSRVLRELVDEWIAWATPRWSGDPRVAPYLADLARHEAIERAVAAAPARDDPPGMSERFAIDARLVFDASARIARYDHAIHTLPEDEDDRSAPPAIPTALLVYRDRDHRVRFLELSPLAAAVVERLLDGARVVDALQAGAAAVGEPVDDERLARMSRLLADLAERGILRGAAPASAAG